MNYIDKLPSDARQVKNTLNWVDRKGNVYGIVVKKKISITVNTLNTVFTLTNTTDMYIVL